MCRVNPCFQGVCEFFCFSAFLFFNFSVLRQGVDPRVQRTHFFTALGVVWRQIRGAAIGSQISPTLSNLAVTLIERSWGSTYQEVLTQPNFHHLAIRYVDSRFVIVQKHHLQAPVFKVFTDLDFYGSPLELELVADNFTYVYLSFMWISSEDMQHTSYFSWYDVRDALAARSRSTFCSWNLETCPSTVSSNRSRCPICCHQWWSCWIFQQCPSITFTWCDSTIDHGMGQSTWWNTSFGQHGSERASCPYLICGTMQEDIIEYQDRSSPRYFDNCPGFFKHPRV